MMVLGVILRYFALGTDGVLRYQRSEDAEPRVCVPAACRRQVLEAAHGGDVLVGHPGVTRTTTAVSRHYYWKSLHKDVAHFVRSCENWCRELAPDMQAWSARLEEEIDSIPERSVPY